MRVLYTRARIVGKSSGFPLATQRLTDLFFRGPRNMENLVQQLLKAFTYAQKNWDKVGKKWFESFTIPKADKQVTTAITK
ncbi:hypothetical protein F441_01953 [Phytophthora nicotianae CJ01A1]|uniref:Uncharacterized protein n=4 Tax=Phytophthora nicotianae TaxID=4792 RepID=W3A3N1_PHYNI|nr:hypothetical protein L915_01903 [Phytophthora nicotianae]ETL48542.1 hypothetical protein L916_01870 [Phytophthora nicotianae]ETP25156.1 hypothetical protein F441_01953 [Phytophthora nicotianae CJ01A1]ETP53149.1 hypothetical protein F442_01928 [Phytophthora nicotianae P10297]